MSRHALKYQAIPTPKQPGAGESHDWYPYYAGYTEAFAEATLRSYMEGSASVIDPWSGSGTTSIVAAREGRPAVGIDINPALTVIAKGRLYRPFAHRELVERVLESGSFSSHGFQHGDDLLETWLTPSAAQHFRRLRAAALSSSPGLANADTGPSLHFVNHLTPETSFLLCSLFLTLRELLRPFRGTNPTWLREPRSRRNRIRPKRRSIEGAFASNVEKLAAKLSSRDHPHRPETMPLLTTGSATELPFHDASFGGALTSPPYATRIDYVRATIPELAVLGASGSAIADLRRASIGGPVVKGVSPDNGATLSPYASRLVKRISHHSSKGSSNYYGPWAHNYLAALHRSMAELSRVVATHGVICIVVQGSFYKEIRVDLQRVVRETMLSLGRRMVERRDFNAPNVKSRMNPRARAHRAERYHRETLLVFT